MKRRTIIIPAVVVAILGQNAIEDQIRDIQ